MLRLNRIADATRLSGSACSRLIFGNSLPRRHLSSTAVLRKATIMDMPAMSPTMEEGGIIEWKVKPGDTFHPGDVLLDVETDKAQISVEAQDDGVMVKILLEDGTKEIPVGKGIAVLAEEEDDISKIDIDALLKQHEKASKVKTEEPPHSAEQASPAPPAPAAAPAAPAGETEAPAENNEHAHNELRKGEIMPSVIRLMHENNISKDQYAGIKGTGPFGRVTKGDALAFLGKVDKSLPAAGEKRIESLSKLDLSNIELAPAKPKEDVQAKPEAPSVFTETEEILFGDLLPSSPEIAISRARRLSTQAVLLSSKPKPSSDSAFDALTATTHPIKFDVLKTQLKVLRAKPYSVEVTVRFGKGGEAQAKQYLAEFRSHLLGNL